MTPIKSYEFTILNNKGEYKTLYEVHYPDSVFIVDRRERLWIPWERKLPDQYESLPKV